MAVLEHRWSCPECGAFMEASDAATLAWGVEGHRCGPAVQHLDVPGRDALECDAVRLLIGMYGRPFAWFSADPERCPLVVT